MLNGTWTGIRKIFNVSSSNASIPTTAYWNHGIQYTQVKVLLSEDKGSKEKDNTQALLGLYHSERCDTFN